MNEIQVKIGTIFEKELPISIKIYKFRKTLSYSLLIDNLYDINYEIKTIKKVREIIEKILENKDLVNDLVKIDSRCITPAMRITMDWSGSIIVTLDKKFAEENNINVDNISIDNILDILSNIEEKLKEEKRKLLDFIKELSRRKLLTIEIVEVTEEEEEEDDC